MLRLPRLAISAVRGGLGKTTIALGIIAAWRKRGKAVAAFKKGPDFIDAGWLGAAAGSPCHNLDLFLMDEESNLRSFQEHAAGRDAAVIEGNRGLHDGLDGAGTYSTARLARLLNMPVVVIVDCTKSTATVAAVAFGMQRFDPDVSVRGLILNNVSGGRHETVIRNAIALSGGPPVVGAVPRLRSGEFPERHMGLTPFQEHLDVEGAIAASAAAAERYLDLEALWSIAAEAAPLEVPAQGSAPAPEGDRPVVGVIRDRAFQFYYPDNLQALERRGAVIREVNALDDRELPEIDALYIGGGFPETQAAQLAGNRSFCRSVRDAVEKGLPVYAECGGLIYLGRSLQVGDATYPMTGVLDAEFVLEKRPQAHGYTEIEVGTENPFFEIGTALRGHEFHYSRIRNAGDLSGLAFTMRRGHGVNGTRDGIVHKNVLAAYTHLHAGGAPAWAAGMVRRARGYRQAGRREVGR